jgi:hypothetical protein
MIGESFGQFPNLRLRIEGDRSILKDIKSRYTEDSLFSKVLKNIRHHKNFKTEDGLLYTRNCADESILCIPSVIRKKRRLTEKIIAQAHKVLGHFGPQKMADYIWRHYWWPRIGQDIEQYCKMCPICQMTKSST